MTEPKKDLETLLANCAPPKPSKPPASLPTVIGAGITLVRSPYDMRLGRVVECHHCGEFDEMYDGAWAEVIDEIKMRRPSWCDAMFEQPEAGI